MSERDPRELYTFQELINEEQPISAHINYGDSEDYYRGFNDGYEHLPSTPPLRDPWRASYLRGYAEGRDWEADDYDWHNTT